MSTVPVCIFDRYPASPPYEPLSQYNFPVPPPICMACNVAGCCCEHCETCDRDVDPWEHFTSAHRDVSLIRRGHQGWCER